LGYTSIRSRLANIESHIRYFVPLGENLEIWQLTLTNHRSEPTQLSFFSAIEFCLWDAWDDATNFQRNYSIGEVEVVDDVIYHKTEYRERRDHFAYLACSEKLSGFDTQREAFLGPHRGWDAPVAVEAGELSGSIAHGWQPVGAQHIKVQVGAWEQKRIIFVLGYHENPRDKKFDPPDSQTLNKRFVKPVITRYLQEDEVDKAFQALQVYWEGLLKKLQVTTPDIHTDRMVNIWNAYQVMATFNIPRSASYFESGIGRGMEFRDSNQYLLGFVQLDPERSRQRLLDLAATQLPSGGAYHQYQPLTKRGNNDIGSGFNDDPLWLVLSLAAYLKETGDWSILEEPVPFDNSPGTEEPLYGHLQRSLKYTLERIGPHGLPLIGRADWNDWLNLNCFSDTPGQTFQTTTNKDGKIAESVFIAGMFILAAGEMVAIAGHLQRKKDVDFYQQAIKAMEEAVWEAGWDGEWFRRAYDDFGNPIGSKENEEGQVYLNTQVWSIISGSATPEQAARCMNTVQERLATPHGLMLCAPPFVKTPIDVMRAVVFKPGIKENAGIFNHTQGWGVMAACMLGDGDRAYEYYRASMPAAYNERAEIRQIEPYVQGQTTYSIYSPRPGNARTSWLTGATAWAYFSATQYILGLRPEIDGLRIDPCIPSTWDGFSVTRRFRGQIFRITVHNPNKVNKGVVKMTIDGKAVPGSLIPPGIPGIKHDVEVWLGTRHA
jgi:cellobiose phosphorylase